MNHFHSLRNNQENYTVVENDKYQIVEPYIGENIVKYGKNVVNYAKENANESYYFLFYTGIFIILFIIIVCVCANPKLIVLNEESNSVLSIVAYIAILGVYLGAIYYYTHISIFYFPESWERFTFIGYGAVLFILVVVFGVMGGIKFEKVKKMLNALGPYKQIQKEQQIQRKKQTLQNQLKQNIMQIIQKVSKQEKEKQIKLQKQKENIQARARHKIQKKQAIAKLKQNKLLKNRFSFFHGFI